MPTLYPLNYQPFLDTNWSINPGACSDMTYMLQKQDGTLVSFERNLRNSLSTFGFTVTGSDHLHAAIFRQVSGSARFLTFRTSNIDEYTNVGARTNRGTGYSASTTAWAATSYGNQVIACNYLDATQSSTGAGFSGLGGGSPKARHIASNINFVMVADVDDGGSNVYSDMVWWSGIRNPNTFTPSQATQAGNVRLLDAPGPIKALVAFGDRFVAFKENAIFVGQYIGPPYVFSWKMISSRIGCSYAKGVTECDGRLFFANTDGVYSFDGQGIQNIGRGMWAPVESSTTSDTVRFRADDIHGNVFIGVHYAQQSVGTFYSLYSYAYNCRTGLWSRQGLICSGNDLVNTPEQPIVMGTTADYRAFLSIWGVASGFAWIDNAASPVTSYGANGGPSNDQPTFTTGKVGMPTDSIALDSTRVFVRPAPTYVAIASTTVATLTPYATESGSAGTAVTLSPNTTIGALDGTLAARFKVLTVTWPAATGPGVAGVGFENIPAGKR